MMWMAWDTPMKADRPGCFPRKKMVEKHDEKVGFSQFSRIHETNMKWNSESM
jgi:hypothetical protein